MYSQPSVADATVSLMGGIIVAIFAYGAFPSIFLLFSPKITFKGFRRICFLVNFIVYLALSLLNGTYSAFPYIIWTFAITSLMRNLHDFYSAEELKSEAEKKAAGQPQPGLKPTAKADPEKSPEDTVIPQPLSAPSEMPLPQISEREKAFCRNCGAQIEITDKFCYKCGCKSPFPSFVSSEITETKQEQQDDPPARSIPVPVKENSPNITIDPFAPHYILYKRCEELVEKYNFDPAALLPIKDMVDTAIREKVDLPDTDTEKMAHTAVFNAMAERLMQHKYAGNDGFFGLSLQGELYLDLLKELGDQMVRNSYLTSAELSELMRNIVETAHQRVYHDPTDNPSPSRQVAPQNSSQSSPRGVVFIAFLVIAIVFALVFIGFMGRKVDVDSPSTIPSSTPFVSSVATPTPTVPVSTPVPTSTPSVKKSLVDVPPNGYMFKTPTYLKLCPLTVSVSGDAYYYVYLEYLRPPGNSYNSRHLEGNPSVKEDDIAFFVRPNGTVKIDVPVGVYKLYYATGQEWLGERNLFGAKTVYSSSSDLLEFYTDYTTFYGSTLELWPQYNGNFDTHYIDEDDFPT